jgi:hypothetical protein
LQVIFIARVVLFNFNGNVTRRGGQPCGEHDVIRSEVLQLGINFYKSVSVIAGVVVVSIKLFRLGQTTIQKAFGSATAVCESCCLFVGGRFMKCLESVVKLR